MGIKSRRHIKSPLPFFFRARFRFHPFECRGMELVLDPSIFKQLADLLLGLIFGLLLKFLLLRSSFRKEGELFSAADS